MNRPILTFSTAATLVGGANAALAKLIRQYVDASRVANPNWCAYTASMATAALPAPGLGVSSTPKSSRNSEAARRCGAQGGTRTRTPRGCEF